jgi:hypothetical protein
VRKAPFSIDYQRVAKRKFGVKLSFFLSPKTTSYLCRRKNQFIDYENKENTDFERGR